MSRRGRALALAAVLGLGPSLEAAEPGPSPVDLREQRLEVRDLQDLQAAGYELVAQGRLSSPSGRLVQENEFALILEGLRRDRTVGAELRARNILHDAALWRPPPAEILEAARDFLREDAQLIPQELRARVEELLRAPPEGPSPPAETPKTDEGRTRATGGAGPPKPESRGRGFDGAAPRSGKEPDLPRPAHPAAPSFTIPSLEYLHDARARVERLPYDDEIKRLLRVMVTHSFEEDSRLALDTLEAHRPQIEIGTRLQRSAAGEAHGMQHIILRPHRLPEDELPTPVWALARLDRLLFGAPIDPDGDMAAVLLHEIVHVATAADGNESQLVNELRSYLADKRTLFLLRGREYLLAHPRFRDVAGLEDWLVPTYARDFGAVDMREDESTTMREQALRLLAAGPAERERAAREEFRRWAQREARYQRELLDQQLRDRQITPEEHGRARRQLEETLERHRRASEDAFRDEDYRAKLARRIERLERDQALYERLVREDRRFNERYLDAPATRP